MGIGMLRQQAAGLTKEQRNAFLAAWLGWAMDAFDYFLLIFVLTDVAKEFDTSYGKADRATFTLDDGTIIKGMVEGLSGVTVGSRVLLAIPPNVKP